MNNAKVKLSAKTMLWTCAVCVMDGKTSNKNFVMSYFETS